MSSEQKKTDAQIHHDVLEELRWDTRVKDTDVGVEVDDGVVTLTGTVDTWVARLAAQDAAHRVAGVFDVANEIKVKLAGSYVRDDTDVARAVRHALEWDVLVPHERIQSTVTNGVVTLEGMVDYGNEREDAEHAIRNLIGVQEVKNLIEVRPVPPLLTTANVRAAIQSALERHVQHAAKHIHVAVIDGKVILTGEVPSWAERNAVEGAVRGTHGVRKVENQVLIRA